MMLTNRVLSFPLRAMPLADVVLKVYMEVCFNLTLMLRSYCELNCVPQNSYVEGLMPNVTIFRDRAF